MLPKALLHTPIKDGSAHSPEGLQKNLSWGVRSTMFFIIQFFRFKFSGNVLKDQAIAPPTYSKLVPKHFQFNAIKVSPVYTSYVVNYLDFRNQFAWNINSLAIRIS